MLCDPNISRHDSGGSPEGVTSALGPLADVSLFNYDVCSSPEADSSRTSGHVRSVPIPEVAAYSIKSLVLLKARGIKLEDVEAVLAQRTSMSGLEEKASRKSV